MFSTPRTTVKKADALPNIAITVVPARTKPVPRDPATDEDWEDEARQLRLGEVYATREESS